MDIKDKDKVIKENRWIGPDPALEREKAEKEFLDMFPVCDEEEEDDDYDEDDYNNLRENTPDEH